MKDFVRGNINRGELEDLYDDIGVRIRNPLGMSDIIIEYKNDTDFFENVLELNDDDIWFEGVVNSSYSDYEFYDYRQVYDDFLEGDGILNYFNSENIEKLKTIAELIIPEKEFNLNDEKYRILLSKTISDLFGVIFVENFSGGIGDSVFVAYLSSLCNVAFSATQYALLVSFATLARSIFASSAGVFAQALGWYEFFIFSTFLALPGLLFLLLLNFRIRH